jgi:hypothetical protein
MNVCSSCGLSPHRDGACPDELEAVREVSEAAVKALAAERAEIARLKEEVARWKLEAQNQAQAGLAAVAKEREKAADLRTALDNLSQVAGAYLRGPDLRWLNEAREALRRTAP